MPHRRRAARWGPPARLKSSAAEALTPSKTGKCKHGMVDHASKHENASFEGLITLPEGNFFVPWENKSQLLFSHGKQQLSTYFSRENKSSFRLRAETKSCREQKGSLGMLITLAN